MGLFGYQKSRKKRIASVGIAEENDLGSFSGLEVAIDDDNNVFRETKKKNFRFQKANQETETKQPKKRTEEKHKRSSKLFFKSRKRNTTDENKQQQQQPLSHQNHGGNYCRIDSSGSSDLLSVYTSSYNINKKGTIDVAVDVPSLQKTGGSELYERGWVVTLDHLSDLVLDLETAVIVGAKQPVRALKKLLALSSLESRGSCPVDCSSSSSSNSSSSCCSSRDNKSVHETRIEMVRSACGKLVPVLLSFLNRCMVESKEHTLALLVMGNLSIPPENKRVSMQCTYFGLLFVNF